MPDPTVWKERAKEFRERAKTTFDAERERLFPLIAEHYERLAEEAEASAEASAQARTA